MNARSSWGWNTTDWSTRQTPERLAWLRPLTAAAPWITVALLLLMLHMLGGTYTAARGLLFDLPAAVNLEDGEETRLVAVVMALPRATLVVFDDAPFELRRDAQEDASGESPLKAFGRQLAERVRQLEGRSREKTLLLLADRRIPGGDLMKIAATARASGVERILFAERARPEGAR